MEFKEITEKIIGCAIKSIIRWDMVFLNQFTKNVYLLNLRKASLKSEYQKQIIVNYEDEVVGNFIADIFVEELIILELKSVKNLAKAHEVQLVNYLVATGTNVGLLINFGEDKVKIKRKVRVL